MARCTILYIAAVLERENRGREMIDETKLIEKIKARKEYLQQQAAECDETGDIENMQLWDAKDFEMDIVLRWIAESKSERGEWIKVLNLKKDSPNRGF